MSIYGPQLPPELVTKLGTSDGLVQEKTSSPDLPVTATIGPSLPPGFTKPVGPERPSAPLEVQRAKRVVGPTLPPGFHPPQSAGHNPPSDDSDDDAIGPSLSLMASGSDYSAVDEVAERFARKAEKLKKSQEPAVLARESWMTDLPADLLGRNSVPTMPLGPRTFKRKTDEYEADFSGWTSGPGGKKSQESQKADADNTLEALQYEQALQRERHLELQIAADNKKKRGESLVTMAQKKAGPELPKERRPFDREVDLSTRKVVKIDKDEVSRRADALKEKFASSAKAGQKFL